MEPPAQIILRPALTGSDHAFLYSTWRNALWGAENRPTAEPDREFKKDTSRMINRILALPGAETRIACFQDDSDMLLGWAVLCGERLEFVYVKKDYRRQGLGRLLTKGFRTFSEPKTRIGKRIAQKLGSSSVAEQAAVNRQVGGSTPPFPAT